MEPSLIRDPALEADILQGMLSPLDYREEPVRQIAKAKPRAHAAMRVNGALANRVDLRRFILSGVPDTRWVLWG
jgi:hypothetical protein